MGKESSQLSLSVVGKDRPRHFVYSRGSCAPVVLRGAMLQGTACRLTLLDREIYVITTELECRLPHLPHVRRNIRGINRGRYGINGNKDGNVRYFGGTTPART
jgi:hypothetical protein